MWNFESEQSMIDGDTQNNDINPTYYDESQWLRFFTYIEMT